MGALSAGQPKLFDFSEQRDQLPSDPFWWTKSAPSSQPFDQGAILSEPTTCRGRCAWMQSPMDRCLSDVHLVWCHVVPAYSNSLWGALTEVQRKTRPSIFFPLNLTHVSGGRIDLSKGQEPRCVSRVENKAPGCEERHEGALDLAAKSRGRSLFGSLTRVAHREA